MKTARSVAFLTTGLCGVILITWLAACRKEQKDLQLEGTVRNARTLMPIGGVYVELEQQVVEDGVFGGAFRPAGEAYTNTDGNFSIKWPRQTIAQLRVSASKSNYIAHQTTLNPDQFQPGVTVTRNLKLYPATFISVRLRNTGETSASDQIRFKFDEADFDCICCSEEWREINGENVDSTFQCMLYGETWLKYRVEFISAGNSGLQFDSIWCPSFQINNLEVNY
jgi:hypothetical protein